MTAYQQIFIKNVRRLMREKDVNQRDVAKAIGVSQASVSDWLAGNIYPRTRYIHAMSVYFGVSMEELTGQEKPIAPTPTVIEQPQYAFTKEEQLLVMKFRCLNESQKSLVRNMLGMFLED